MTQFNYLPLLQEMADNILTDDELLKLGYIKNRYDIENKLSTIFLMKIQNGEFDNGVYFILRTQQDAKIYNYLRTRISAIGMNIVNNKENKEDEILYTNWNLFLIMVYLRNDDVERANKLLELITHNLNL